MSFNKTISYDIYYMITKHVTLTISITTRYSIRFSELTEQINMQEDTSKRRKY